jgi:hypothetical protein
VLSQSAEIGMLRRFPERGDFRKIHAIATQTALPHSRRSFLQNRTGTATLDMFVVATASFRLHAVIVLDHHGRCIIHWPLPGVSILLP